MDRGVIIEIAKPPTVEQEDRDLICLINLAANDKFHINTNILNDRPLEQL